MITQECIELSVLDVVPFGQVSSDTAHFFALRLESPRWKDWKPGQFVMLRPSSWGAEFTWARPFSICRISKRDMVIFFQAVGRGTQSIAQLSPGDKVLVWGPLGNGFVIEPDTQTLILAGGIGIAPFVGYTEEHPKPWNVCMEFGHRLPLGCYPFDSINEKIIVDDHLETCPDDLQDFIARMDSRMEEYAAQNGLVIACGPTPFLRTVQDFAQKHNVRCQISLENRMACGVGACLGCVTRTTEDHPLHEITAGRIQVCNHGPVFWSNQVDLSKS